MSTKRRSTIVDDCALLRLCASGVPIEQHEEEATSGTNHNFTLRGRS